MEGEQFKTICTVHGPIVIRDDSHSPPTVHSSIIFDESTIVDYQDERNINVSSPVRDLVPTISSPPRLPKLCSSPSKIPDSPDEVVTDDSDPETPYFFRGDSRITLNPGATVDFGEHLYVFRDGKCFPLSPDIVMYPGEPVYKMKGVMNPVRVHRDSPVCDREEFPFTSQASMIQRADSREDIRCETTGEIIQCESPSEDILTESSRDDTRPESPRERTQCYVSRKDVCHDVSWKYPLGEDCKECRKQNDENFERTNHLTEEVLKTLYPCSTLHLKVMLFIIRQMYDTFDTERNYKRTYRLRWVKNIGLIESDLVGFTHRLLKNVICDCFLDRLGVAAQRDDLDRMKGNHAVDVLTAWTSLRKTCNIRCIYQFISRLYSQDRCLTLLLRAHFDSIESKHLERISAILRKKVATITQGIVDMYAEEGFHWDGYFRFINTGHPLYLAFTGKVPLTPGVFEGLVPPYSLKIGETMVDDLSTKLRSDDVNYRDVGLVTRKGDRPFAIRPFDNIGFQKRELRQAIIKAVTGSEKRKGIIKDSAKVDVVKKTLNLSLLTGKASDKEFLLPGFAVVDPRVAKYRRTDYAHGYIMGKSYYEHVYRRLMSTTCMAPVESLSLMDYDLMKKMTIRNGLQWNPQVTDSHIHTLIGVLEEASIGESCIKKADDKYLSVFSMRCVKWFVDVYNKCRPYVEYKGEVGRVPESMIDSKLGECDNIDNTETIMLLIMREMTGMTTEAVLFICDSFGCHIKERDLRKINKGQALQILGWHLRPHNYDGNGIIVCPFPNGEGVNLSEME